MTESEALAREATRTIRLVHGGYDLATTFTGCAEWYVASIVVAAVPAFPVARPVAAAAHGPRT